MARSHLVRALSLGLLAVAAGSAAAANAGRDDYLARFGGRWYGAGQLRRAPGAPVQPVRCNLSGQAQGGALDMQGQCAGPDFSVHVRTQLRYDPRMRRYTGTWQGGTAAPPANLAGARQGEALSLDVTGLSGSLQPQTGRMTLQPTGKRGFRFLLQEMQAGAASFVDIAFRPAGTALRASTRGRGRASGP